jgi:IclR family pca regulon transcriptional regulator
LVREKKNAADTEYIAGLEKGLAVIEAFSQQQPALTVTEASEAAGLSRAAARRCLLTLQRLGYAEYDGKYYRLLPRVLRLGHAYVNSSPLPRFVQPIIEATSERTQHSMSVAVLDEADVLVIARALVHRSLSSGLGVGSRLPAYCSANGRVLLSEWPDAEIQRLLVGATIRRLTGYTKISASDILKEIKVVRARGYALNDQEVEIGVRTIAVPIRSRSGQITASLSMSAPPEGADAKALIGMLPELDAARSRIEAVL